MLINHNARNTMLTNTILDRMLTKPKAPDLGQTYKAFESLKGIGGTGIRDASTTIIYGEKKTREGRTK